MNLLLFLLTVLLFGGALAAIYFALVRPAFIFWVQRSAIAVRDDLQLAVKSGEIGAHERAVAPTMKKLYGLACGCEHIGIATVFLNARNDATIKYEAEREAQITREAGSTMKEIIIRADILLVAAIVLNSPFFWSLLGPLYAIGALSGKITRWINVVSLAGKDGSGGTAHGGLATV